jgi:hypothetical protein
MSTALLEHGITKSGILPIANFKDILERRIYLGGDESSHVIMHYDPMHRQSIKVAEFLTDLKEHLFEKDIRIQLTELIQSLGFSSTIENNGGLNKKEVLQRYQ